MPSQFFHAIFYGWLNNLRVRALANVDKHLFQPIILLVLCAVSWTGAAQATIPASERAVLTALYASTNGPEWANRSGWNGAVGTECFWIGVRCNAALTNVISVQLVANGLAGTLPPLDGLTALQEFSAFLNRLTGAVPSLGRLTALRYFDVKENQLTGPIPELSGLSVLEIFDVQNNQLTGSIPFLNGLSALQYFDANGNLLTGPIPALSSLTNLQNFRVSSNFLTGTIPSLGGLANLQSFSVASNQLTGTMPSLSGLPALTNLAISGNQLTGPIPSLSGLSALEYFSASYNQLTGQIPSLSGLTALRSFYANDNQLSGSIPSLGGPIALNYFVVDNNQLSGPVPPAPTTLTASGSGSGLSSDLCINNLASSGNASIDAAWVKATGINWLSCQSGSVAAPPYCVLTAMPLRVLLGGSSTLTASCGPAATTFTWTGGTCAGTTGATCIVAPSAITSYSVTGRNNAGPGNRATWSIGAARQSPSCTLIASPASIIAGGSSTLTANCSPAATAYSWTGGSCVGTTGANCFVSPTDTTSYTVAGSNVFGTGSTADATVTVGAAAPFFFCTLTASSGSISSGGTSTLSTSCTFPAIAYAWTGGSCVNFAGPNCTVSPSVTTTYTVTASGAGTTYTASATVTVLPTTAAPVCSLTVTPSAIQVGRSATLTASCTPAASAYSWIGGTCPGTNGPTCVVSPAVTTSYSVTASTANGGGNRALATVTIVQPVFPMTVTGSITPPVANITANIQFRPQDVGTTGSVYVFALAPASMVRSIPSSAVNELKGPATGAGSAADAPPTCVLAQLVNGDLSYATLDKLQATLTGVFSIPGPAIAVLNGVNTASIAGAIFYVGYGTDSNKMIMNGTSQNVVAVPGTVACQPQTPQSGWWWYPQQDGRGFGIEVQGNNMFMSGYLYDDSGRATWMVAEGKVSFDGSLFSSTLYQVQNGQTLTGEYKKPTVSNFPGAITLSFTSARNGTLSWPGGIIPIQRFDDVIGSSSGTTPAFVPENGWWWSADESGRGYFMEFKNNFAFIAGYMYDSNGRPVWYLAQGAMVAPTLFSSNWYEVANGQTLTGTYKAPIIINSTVGLISILFQSTTTALLTLPNGRQISITRQRY